MTTTARATLHDLYCVPENTKAELIHGELILMSPTGAAPGRAGGRIYFSLDQYERRTKRGYAFPDNVGFSIHLPDRESFSPHAAFHTGPLSGMQFLVGAPIFAAEVRSEGDCGPQAELDMAAKRRDYFAAGTLVVWDVDMLSAGVVQVYREQAPDRPTTYRRGETAEAEPALPGWTMPVDDLF